MPEEYIQKDGYQLHTMWNDMDFGGSALVGTIDATVEETTKYLGEPMIINGRMDIRWLMKFDDGTVATIFRYRGETELRVGGFREISAEKVKEWLVSQRQAYANAR